MKFGSSLTAALFFAHLFSLPGAAQEKPTRVNLAYSSISGSQAILRVMKDAGIFQKNGLDANLVFIAGGSGVIQALIAGDLSIAARERRTFDPGPPSGYGYGHPWMPDQHHRLQHYYRAGGEETTGT